MTTPKITINNVETGEIETRDLTGAEIAEIQAQTTADNNVEATKAAEKAALLAKLGITDDEAKLLLS
jgi:hypothetical protein